MVEIELVPIPHGFFYHPDDDKLAGPLYTLAQIEAGVPYTAPSPNKIGA